MTKHPHPNDELPEAKLAPDEDAEKRLAEADGPGKAGILTFLGVSVEALRKLIIDRIALEGNLKFLSQVEEVGTHSNLLYFALDANGGEVLRQKEFLDENPDPKMDYRLMNDDKTRTILGVRAVEGDKSSGKQTLSGQAGVLKLIASRKGNVRRIPLYNSGFSIDICVPTVDQISTLLRQCRLDRAHYESQIGAPFYMYFDRLLKVNFIEFLRSLIVFSTLENYQKGEVLLTSIKLADYNAIMGHIAALMFPKGYEQLRHFCTRPLDKDHPNGCDHVTEVKADLYRLIQTRYSKLDADAVAHMVRAADPQVKITQQDLVKYQTMLGFDRKAPVVFGEYRFHLTTPTLADHLEAAEAFNTILLNEVEADNTNGILTAMKPRELRVFLPYIKRVEQLDEFGEVANIIDDKYVIQYILDEISGDEKIVKEFSENLRAYINDSQLTYVCYPVFECPACKYVPDIPSNFFVLDAQNTFFTTALLKSLSVF